MDPVGLVESTANPPQGTKGRIRPRSKIVQTGPAVTPMLARPRPLGLATGTVSWARRVGPGDPAGVRTRAHDSTQASFVLARTGNLIPQATVHDRCVADHQL